jgi:hypothetical protein
MLKCAVVMLTTESKSNGIFYLDDVNYIPEKAQIEPKKTKWNEAQHLYITSNRPTKDGDWFLEDDNVLRRYNPTSRKDISNGLSIIGDYDKKIEATTDPSLAISKPTGTSFPDKYLERLPQIPESFIKAYVESYNAGKPITEVLLETVQTRGIKPDDFMINTRTDNTVIIHHIKDSYTRDEVLNILSSFNEHLWNQSYMRNRYGTVGEWFEKNY